MHTYKKHIKLSAFWQKSLSPVLQKMIYLYNSELKRRLDNLTKFTYQSMMRLILSLALKYPLLKCNYLKFVIFARMSTKWSQMCTKRDHRQH